MNRKSWILFSMVVIVMISIALVALLIFIPQSEPVVDVDVEEYIAIDPSEFSYTQSKDISQEAMRETYSVTTEDIKEGKASKLYKQGNADPFADSNASENTNTNTNVGNISNGTISGSNAVENGNNIAGGASNNISSERPVSAEDK